MKINITSVEVRDIRFPTSRSLDGSDAMNPDPDYSAAYIILHTNQPGLQGHGLTFTIGRGNEICCAALQAYVPMLQNRSMNDIIHNFGAFYQYLTGDSQLRWLGPEKGVIHMAAGAVVNALWDLYAKMAGKPLWRLLADMSPEELLRCLDLSYLEEVLPPEEVLRLLKTRENGKAERIRHLEQHGYPAYTTSAGWMGYADEKIRGLCREAIRQGFGHIKMKVGLNLEDDMRRAAIIREEIGYERHLMMDANQKWGVSQAVKNMKELAAFRPYWIEEPTNPDDILGHARIAEAVRPIKVATGEHCHNRVMFKQLMQTGGMDICQIDSCRVGGVNENLVIMLLAAKFDTPVCPHAGGVGLCEYVQHLAMFDYIAISGSLQGRMIEYVDHLHEHFLDPVSIRQGCYMPPLRPGYSIEMKQESLRDYAFPQGKVWAAEPAY